MILTKNLSRVAKRIYQIHKIFDKGSGGYINGQEMVFVLRVPPLVTIKLKFSFYLPDPAYTAFQSQDKKLKKRGIPKKERPISKAEK